MQESWKKVRNGERKRDKRKICMFGIFQPCSVLDPGPFQFGLQDPYSYSIISQNYRKIIQKINQNHTQKK